MAEPVGEDGWLAFLDEASRTANDIERRVAVVEQYKDRAIASEPWSLKLWLAYCEWFWSLHTDCQTADAGWPEDEQAIGQELFSLPAALQLWEEGYYRIQYRINDSSEFWNRWISIELEELKKSTSREKIERLRNIFLTRLQTPHGSWDETAQKLSAFLTEYDEASYESTMVAATRTSVTAKNLWSLREVHELKIQRANESDDVEIQKFAMKDYLDWECKQARMVPKKNKPKNPEILCVALFERALCSAALGLDPETWQEYCAWIGQYREAQEPDITTVYQRATAHCIGSGMLWARYILAAEAQGYDHHRIEMIKHSATNSNLDRDGMASVVEVYIAWCGYLSRRASIPGAHEEDIDLADMGLPTALEDVRTWGQKLHGKEYKGDPLFRIERIMIQYFTHKGHISEARGYWKDLIGNHADSYEFWQQYYLWEMTVRDPHTLPKIATEVLVQSISRHLTMDWPEKMLEVYTRHVSNYADAATLINALDSVHFIHKRVTTRREKEAVIYAQQHPVVENAHLEDSPPSSSSKRKRDSSTERGNEGFSKKIKSIEHEPNLLSSHQQVERDRENTTALVTNLPLEITQTKVRQYFKDYGHINNITMKPEKDGLSSTAFIEFRSNGDLQSALLRDGKYLTDKQIHVAAATDFTLYLTNYPPAADEAFFQKLFKECGEIFSIRYPSLKFKATRRFCYATFRTHKAAAAATKLHGRILDGGFKLSAMYSNPSAKKSREGPVEEGRELHVTSLDPALNEDDLREIFSKYGMVETIRILRNYAGMSKGAGFVIFERKEDAISALDLDKTKVKSKVITVEVSKSKNQKIATSNGFSASPAPDVDEDFVMSQSPAPEGRGNAYAQSNCTITLMNIPDTFNDARVRALVEKFGNVVKVVLRPDHQGAIVEYEDASSTGKAALALEGFEIIPGRKLRTGGMRDLFALRGEKKSDIILVGSGKNASDGKKPVASAAFIQPSAPIRRPGPGGRGGLGMKKGLGFAKPKPSSSAEASNGNGEVDEKVATKSNADFKNIFLGGGNQ